MLRAALVLLPLAFGLGMGLTVVRKQAHGTFWAVVAAGAAAGLGPALYILFGYRLQLCGSSDCGAVGGLFYVAGLGSLIFVIGWVAGGLLGRMINGRDRAGQRASE